MLDYLAKFKDLSPDIKQGISTPGVSAAIKNLEDKYHVSLASIIMRIMIKDIKPDDFMSSFVNDLGLSSAEARELINDFKHSVFFGVKDYIYNDNSNPVFSNDFFIKAIDKNENDESVKADDFKEENKIVQGDDLPARAINIINKSGLIFSSSELRNRLEKIIVTYLKGIREKIVTKESLMKNVELGGLGLDLDKAELILNLADGKNVQINNENKVEPLAEEKVDIVSNQAKTSIMDLIEASNKKLAAATARDVDYDFLALTKKKQKELPVFNQPEELMAGINDNRLQARTPDDLLVQKSAKKITSSDIVRINKPKEEKENKEIHKPLGAVLEHTLKSISDNNEILDRTLHDINQKEHDKFKIIKRQDEILKTQTNVAKAKGGNWQKTDSGKPVLADVLSRPRVYSPIDELRFMTIKNFRNLSKNPEQAADFIIKKIKNIIEEDFGKKVEAITAWKQSPVNRMYVEVCKIGLMESKPALKVLAKKQKEDSNFLTNVEFEAIIQLNKNLNSNL